MQKSNYLKAIMNSPKTAKIVRDAWSAPTGSTKRDQASAIFKSLQRVSARADGQGGPNDMGSSTMPGMPGMSGVGTSTAPMDKTYQDLNASSTMPGQTRVPTVLTPAPKDLGFNQWSMQGPVPSLISKIPGAVGDATANVVGTISALPDLVKYGALKILGTEYGWARNMLNSAFSPNFKGTPVEQNNPLIDMSDKAGIAAVQKTPWLTAMGNAPAASPSGTLAAPGTNADGTKIPEPVGVTPTVVTPEQQAAQVAADAAAGSNGTAVDSSQLPWQALSAIVKAGMDAGMPVSSISSTIMGNKDLLQQLFPGIPADYLPSSTMAQTVADLEARLKEGTGLTDLANKKMNLINAGGYLVQDLTDYIQGRDQYVTKIDGMIMDAKNKSLGNSLMNDPASMASNQSYLNTLYLLKGQQNKRYMDLVNAATTKYNADVASLDNEVTSAADEYKTLLAQDVPIAQDQYTQIANTITQYINTYDGLINGGGNVWDGVKYDAAGQAASGAVPAAKPADYTKVNADLSTRFSADGGKTLMTFGLPTKIQEVIKDGYTGKQVYTYLEDMIAKTASSGSISSLNQMKNAVIDLKRADGDQIFGMGGVVNSLSKGVTDAAKYPIKTYVSGNYPAIAQAVVNLVNDVKNPNDAAKASQWKNDAISLGLDPTFVNALFLAYQIGFRDLKAGQKPEMIFDLSGRNFTDVDQTTGEDTITGAIAAAWASEINNAQVGG